jgi:murein DD-endopeptidase MepM/ murein hydrolase activator NlpD
VASAAEITDSAALATSRAMEKDARDEPKQTPTPDAPHPLPTLRSDSTEYVVAAGDTLGNISNRYGVSLDEILAENKNIDPNLLEIGQVIKVPPPKPDGDAPGYKIIPDSELVYGLANAGFDAGEFVRQQEGYLAGYTEEIDEKEYTGVQIVNRVAQDYSVNPRLLLAVLEHQSGWVTQPEPANKLKKYPMGLESERREGLYLQLTWAANNLNRGYYLWRVNGVGAWLLEDGTILLVDPTINAGTAGIQHFFSNLQGKDEWLASVSPEGFQATYQNFYGNPFAYAIEPYLADDLTQPQMQLPFENNVTWSLTSGPHGGWADGSAWAALDFAPPGEALGCVQSDEWVTAVADGLILRTGNGAVIQDLDGDGLEQTGWVVLYMHIESRDSVHPGTYLRTGQRVGHPSCEGGISNGTHVHIARKYNGEWIAADQDLPFVLSGWISNGYGQEYDGYLERGGTQIIAYAGRSDENQITK